MITLEKPDFLRVLPDGDEAYIRLLSIVVEYSDSEAKVRMNKLYNGIGVSISPKGETREEIIDNLLLLHRLLQIKIHFSKSLKAQKSVYFSINFDE